MMLKYVVVFLILYCFCWSAPFANFLLTYANVCVSPVGFLPVRLYVVFVRRAGAWDIVCIPVACPCVSGVGACTRGSVSILTTKYHTACRKNYHCHFFHTYLGASVIVRRIY
jgi:hypothetical protein